MHNYFVCNETNLDRLEALVNDKLNDGYLLAGHLVIQTGSTTWFYQPMIKYTYPTINSLSVTPEPEPMT